MLRSPRASALRFEVEPAPRSSASPEPSVEDQALLTRPYMHSPPSSFGDSSAANHRLRRTEGLSNLIAAAAPTPGFAPARGVHHENDERQSLIRRRAPREHTPPGEASWTDSYPPLQRVNHLSPGPDSGLSRYGGLGDRHRSVSSSSSEPTVDDWSVLLTTLEPDINLPSTDSSFTSASASQSTRQSRQPSQSNNTSFTTATTPTERLSSQSTTLNWLLTPDESPQMAMDIRSTQYDCLSGESRASMRAMLEIIQISRQTRVRNAATDSTAFRLASRRRQAATELTFTEHRRQTEDHRQRIVENRIANTHFNTLRRMDDLGATLASQVHAIPTTEPSSPHSQTARTTNNPQLSIAEDLVATVLNQTQEVTRQIREAQNGRNFRRATPNMPGLGSAQAAEALAAGIELHRQNQQMNQQMNRQMTQRRSIREAADTENDVDLENMQQVIERMARREDIPDEWWAAAGLARTIRENQ
jgi:hypothetical protein